MACVPELERDVYLPEPATLVRAQPMTATERFLELKLESGRALGHMPGQFVQVSVPGFGEAPLSISSSPTDGEAFQLVVRRVGSLTGALHRLAPGAALGVRGPYGTHFPVDTDFRGRDLLFICGGIGLVPVRSAIRYVLHRRQDYGRVIILFGARTPKERLFTDELAAWAGRDDVEFLETVDRADGEWEGNVGVITTLMPKLSVEKDRTVAVICGPPVMYKFVLMGLYDMGIGPADTYVSLERRMKCGVGKCGHCQINGLYCCIDGPVFRFAELEGVTEAIG